MAQDKAQKLRELVKDGASCMMTTLDADGALVSRPMGLRTMDDEDCLWFFTDKGEPKTQQIGADARVGLTFHDDGWVSISGRGDVIVDVAKQKELWGPEVAAWMQCDPDDPKVALVRVRAEGGQYWTSTDAIPALIELVVSKITGRGEDSESSGTNKVDLG